MALRQPNVLPGFGLYFHALRATSTGIAQGAKPVHIAALRAGGMMAHGPASA
jgi:hypothetical protein